MREEKVLEETFHHKNIAQVFRFDVSYIYSALH